MFPRLLLAVLPLAACASPPPPPQEERALPIHADRPHTIYEDSDEPYPEDYLDRPAPQVIASFRTAVESQPRAETDLGLFIDGALVPLHELVIYSTTNDNSRFVMRAVGKLQEWGSRRPVEFRVDGQVLPIFSLGSNPDETCGELRLDRDQALRIAQLYEVEAYERRPPPHRWELSFSPEEGQVQPDGPIIVHMRLTNTGKFPIDYFPNWNFRRPYQDPRLAFRVWRDGKLVKEYNHGSCHRGFRAGVRIWPLWSSIQRFDLALWVGELAPGEYEIEGRYSFTIDDFERELSTWGHVEVWNASASAWFRLSVEPVRQ